MLGKAAGILAAALAMTGDSPSISSRGLSEEGMMLKMSPEDRLAYDKKRRKRKTPIRTNNKFDYAKRNKRRREAEKSRKANRS